MGARVKLIYMLVLIFIVSSSTSTARADWEIESENDKTGISTYAQVFWAQDFGPLTLDELFSTTGDDGDYWGIFTVTCSKKTLVASLGLNHFGSGHDEIRIDNPGFVDMIFNNRFKKRYRTSGTDYPNRIFISGSEAKKLVQEILKRNTMSTVVKNKSTRDRFPVLFDVGGLSKAKTRFKYAGCKI